MHHGYPIRLRQWLTDETPKDPSKALSDAVVLLLRAINRTNLTDHERKLVRARGLLVLASLGMKEQVERALS